ncbi:hypothetical protein [Janthinobacterium sp. RB2P8]|uniref:hypothetical protein n=1 Tax=Janthinobacterium sp. RB2P8 TaxID=3424191 RepID=UPI003F275714
MNSSVRAGAALLLALALLLAGAVWLQPAPGGAAAAVLALPDAVHWLGTDDLGRDVLRRLAAAAAPTLLIGVATSGASIALAVLLALAGLAWPAADAGVLRLADLFDALPSTLIFIVIAAQVREIGAEEARALAVPFDPAPLFIRWLADGLLLRAGARQ